MQKSYDPITEAAAHQARAALIRFIEANANNIGIH